MRWLLTLYRASAVATHGSPTATSPRSQRRQLRDDSLFRLIGAFVAVKLRVTITAPHLPPGTPFESFRLTLLIRRLIRRSCAPGAAHPIRLVKNYQSKKFKLSFSVTSRLRVKPRPPSPLRDLCYRVASRTSPSSASSNGIFPSRYGCQCCSSAGRSLLIPRS